MEYPDMSMSSRERVLAAINHQQPDRLPLDLGATRVTGIQPGLLTKLRQALLGVAEEPVKVFDVWQMLAWVDQEVVDALGADALPVPRLVLDFNMRLDQWRPWTLWDGTPVQMPGNFNPHIEEDGGLSLYLNGEMVARKAPSSTYFDKTLETRLSYTPPPIESIPLFTLSDEELAWRRHWAETLRSETDKALVGDFGFNLGRWGSYQEWLFTLGDDPDYVRSWYDCKIENLLANIQLYAEAVGNKIDVVWLMEDFGTQKGMMISPKTFKDLVAPYYKRLFTWIHANTPWKIFFHSCGGIYPIIGSLIDCGVDILNPVQTTAAGMDPNRLKAEFGEKISFWGGGIDTQDVLPFGSAELIREQVRERIEIFGRGGGFIFNPIHNVQEDVPVENLLAMYKAVQEFRQPV
jgi:uroporphyrinogen-III decarboxylase